MPLSNAILQGTASTAKIKKNKKNRIRNDCHEWNGTYINEHVAKNLWKRQLCNGIPKKISEPGFGTKASKPEFLALDISVESSGNCISGRSGKVPPSEKTRSWR